MASNLAAETWSAAEWHDTKNLRITAKTTVSKFPVFRYICTRKEYGSRRRSEIICSGLQSDSLFQDRRKRFASNKHQKENLQKIPLFFYFQSQPASHILILCGRVRRRMRLTHGDSAHAGWGHAGRPTRLRQSPGAHVLEVEERVHAVRRCSQQTEKLEQNPTIVKPCLANWQSLKNFFNPDSHSGFSENVPYFRWIWKWNFHVKHDFLLGERSPLSHCIKNICPKVGIRIF